MSLPGMCGRSIDRYEILEWVGGGGFGAVYKARHKVMHRTVALKLVRPSVHQPPDIIERFITEARAAASIGNPHIIEVYDAGSIEDGTHFLAMELIDGCSLGRLLDVEKVLSVERAGALLLQVLDALSAAHAAGIIHRDIKPGNIMLEGTIPGGPARDHVKILDFGISKAAYLDDTPTTKSGMSMGTPGYAAPEQYVAAKDVDHRADIYAASVVLFKALTGRLPFEAESYEAMVVKVCTQAPAPIRTLRPDLPAALADVVDRGLRTKREERFTTTEELRTALAAAVSGETGPVTMPSGPHALPQSGEDPVSWSGAVVAAASSTTVPTEPGRRVPILAIALVAALGLFAGLGSVAYFMTNGEPETTTPTAHGPTEPAGDPVEPAPDPQPEVEPENVEPENVEPENVEPEPPNVEPEPDPTPVATADPVDEPDPSVEPEPTPEPSGRRRRRRRRSQPTPRPMATPTTTPTTTPTPTPRTDPYARPGLVPFDSR